MAWNQMAATPSQKLHRIKDWAAKGLPYWESRLVTCRQRIRDAECSSQVGRAIADRDIAEAAIAEIKELSAYAVR